MKKDPQNCPFCEAEEKGYSVGWGGSPEFWAEKEKEHKENHCIKCPTCGQSIINPLTNLNG